MIKYAFFDWNGTLLADTTLRYHLLNAGLRFMGQPEISRRDFHKHHAIPISQLYRNLNIPEAVVAEKAEAERVNFHAGYEAGAAKAHTRHGARALLGELHRRGITRIILSNHTVQGIKEQLHRLVLEHHFDEILANDNIHTAGSRGKKGLLQEYLVRQSIDPAEAVIIGDTVEEIHIGKEFGLKTVAITGGIHTKARLAAERPDAVIERLTDLIKVIEDFE